MRRCPDLIFVPPRFDVYRAVSQQIHEIFAEFTDLIVRVSGYSAYFTRLGRSIQDDLIARTEFAAC